MAHDIDLRDPAIARLMGKDTGIVTPGELASGKRELVQIAGDPDHGITSTTRLDLGKREIGVLIRPKGSDTMIDGVLTLDVYAIPGEPVKAVIVCPRCHHRCEIDADKKAIDWNPTAPCPFPKTLIAELPPQHHYLAAQLGVISIETFRCKWELEDQMQDAGKDIHVMVSGSLCRFTCTIERNVLREA
jgi:hypothetical protein